MTSVFVSTSGIDDGHQPWVPRRSVTTAAVLNFLVEIKKGARRRLYARCRSVRARLLLVGRSVAPSRSGGLSWRGTLQPHPHGEWGPPVTSPARHGTATEQCVWLALKRQKAPALGRVVRYGLELTLFK